MIRNNKKNFKFNIYLFLIMFASLFMSTGFAAISAVNLSIGGNAVARAQDGVFISGGTVLGTSESVLNSSVTLSSSNSSSTVTCNLTLYNNSNISYYYDNMIYDTSDVNFYSNTNIVPSVDISQGDEITTQGTLTLHVTFGYKSGVTPSSSINTLTSYINFRFVDNVNNDVKLVDAILALIDGQTPTDGVYSVKTGVSGCSYKLAYDGSTNNTDNNLRFVGSNPCNYVTFNGETWRIIGVMNNVPATDSTTHDPLVKLINPSVYNNTTIAFNNNTNSGANVWTNTSLYKNTLSSLAVTNNAMVESVKWYNDGPAANTNTAETFYLNEKGTTTFPIKIGLFSVSDYGYATDNVNTCRSTQLSTWSGNANKTNCVTNHNWLYLNTSYPMLTTTIIHGRNTIFRVNASGNPYSASANSTGYVYPVVYLKNNVLVDSGDGDANTPYTLKINNN